MKLACSRQSSEIYISMAAGGSATTPVSYKVSFGLPQLCHKIVSATHNLKYVLTMFRNHPNAS